MLTFIKRRFGKFIERYIPTPTKRMLVLAGATTTISKLIPEDRRDVFIKQLNEKMDLAIKQESINFAIEVGKLLWRDLQSEYMEKSINRQILINEIYARCPESLKYADENTMKHDIGSAILFTEAWNG